MNLVQINEHLKDVPLQALMQYANGQDPMVPAYMATGEMKRREVMQQKQSQAQQAAQGQSPTVKDQVEQQAGLMALQAQQQKQAQQQMMQQAQARPMPAPPQTPQPVPQGEEQAEFAMGGIARLPVNYDFASGGIIAFAGEGRSDVPVVEETEEEKKMRVVRGLLSKGNNPMSQSVQGMNPVAAQPADQGEKPITLEDLMTGPATMKAAQQALNPQGLEDINKARLQARELAGVTGEYGADQRRRLSEEEAQYKAMLKDRQFDNLIAVLSGMGRGGLGGAGPAYLQNKSAQQAADIAQKRRMTERYGDIDAKAREEGMAAATSMTGEVSKQRGLAGEAGTKYVVEAANNQNAKDRLEIEYQNQLKQAQLRFANDQELRKIENDYAVKRDKINKDSQFALEKYRQSAPTDEQRNFEAYLARWKKNPENKGKPETEAFAQYSMDRVGGPGRGDKPYITGLNQLLESYQKDLEDITLPESEKVRIRGLIAKTRKDLEAAVSKGLPSALSGGNVDTNNPLLK
jgi:nitroreductase